MRLRSVRTVLLILALLMWAAVPALAQRRPVPNFRVTTQAEIVAPDATLMMVWYDGDFTEGPAPMADGTILFSDIGNRIMRYSPRSKTTTIYRQPSGKANGLMFDPRGRLVACEGAGPGGGRRLSITDEQGQVHTLADSFEGKRFNSPNDLAITASGAIYFTDPRYVGDEPRELDFEGVFLIEPNGQVRLATRDVEKPNGILVSIDGKTVYVADNNSDPKGAHQLLAFRVDPDGTLAEKRVLFDFGPDRRGIDGMTLDERGNIYATAGSGDEGGVYVFNPQGVTLAFLPIPGDPTNCVFGVGEHRSRLYITGGGPPPRNNEIHRFGLYYLPLKIPGHHVYPKVMP